MSLNDKKKYNLFLAHIANEKEFTKEINNLFKIFLKDSFKNILNIPKIDFLSKLLKDVNSILVSHYSNKILENENLEKLLNLISEKYEKRYDEFYEDLRLQWKKYTQQKSHIKDYENKDKKLDSFYLKNNFIKHCSKTGEYALHCCDKNKKLSKFIVVYSRKKNDNDNNNNNEIKYIICENCRKAYFIKDFKNYCQYCNIKYYTTILKLAEENDLSSNDLFLATVYPSHCNVLFNKVIICPKCNRKLYINIKKNILICLNKKCDYVNNNPDNLEWECNKCETKYMTRVILYNEIEIIHFEDKIKSALFLKKLAHPKKTCCINSENISSIQFFHNKKCHGVLYFFKENKNLFLVCEKCKAINYFKKFIWTCPFCGLYYREINSEENEMDIIQKDVEKENEMKTNSRNKRNLYDYIRRKKYCKSIEIFDPIKPKIEINKISLGNLYLNNNTNYKINTIEKIEKMENIQRQKNISTDFSTSILDTNYENNINSGNSQAKRCGLFRKLFHDFIKPFDEKTYNSVGKRYIISNINENTISYENLNKNEKKKFINNLRLNSKLIRNNHNYSSSLGFSKEDKNRIFDIKNYNNMSSILTVSSRNDIKNDFSIDNNQNIFISNHENNKYINNKKNNVTNLIYKNKRILNKKEVNNTKIYKKNIISKEKYNDKYTINKDKSDEKNKNRKNIFLYRKCIRGKNNFSNRVKEDLLNNTSVNKLKNMYNSVETIKSNKFDYSISSKMEYNTIKNNNDKKINDNSFSKKIVKKNISDVYNNNNNYYLSSYKKRKYIAYIKDKPKEEYKTIENKSPRNRMIFSKKDLNIENLKKKEMEKVRTQINNLYIKNSIEKNKSKINHLPKQINSSKGRLKKYFLNNLSTSFNNNNISNEIMLINEENKEDKDEIISFNEKSFSIDDDFIGCTLSNAIKMEDVEMSMNKNLYDIIKMRLINIVSESNLPLFDVDNYLIWKRIGDGSNGEIFEIENNRTDKKYALKKIITDNINSLESIIKEFQIIYQNKHKHIINIYGICVKCIHQNSYILYVLMDLALYDWEVEIIERQKINKFYTEKELIIILKQLVSALLYLQKEKSISHRDIKCENVLIFNNFIYKLCDFGEAKSKVERNVRKTLRGTDFYMSPLLYNGLINHESYVQHNPYKSDVFSLGFCLVISAALNFDIIDDIRKLKDEEKIKEVVINYFNGRYSNDFIYIMMKMISIDEKKRPDFIELNRIINNYYSFDIDE